MYKTTFNRAFFNYLSGCISSEYSSFILHSSNKKNYEENGTTGNFSMAQHSTKIVRNVIDILWADFEVTPKEICESVPFHVDLCPSLSGDIIYSFNIAQYWNDLKAFCGSKYSGTGLINPCDGFELYTPKSTVGVRCMCADNNGYYYTVTKDGDGAIRQTFDGVVGFIRNEDGSLAIIRGTIDKLGEIDCGLVEYSSAIYTGGIGMSIAADHIKNLKFINPELPIAENLEYRERHKQAVDHMRPYAKIHVHSV